MSYSYIILHQNNDLKDMKIYTKCYPGHQIRPLPARLSYLSVSLLQTADAKRHDQPLRGPPASMCMPSPASCSRLSSPLRPAGLPTPPGIDEATSMALQLTLSPRSESNFPSGDSLYPGVLRTWPAAPFFPLCKEDTKGTEQLVNGYSCFSRSSVTSGSFFCTLTIQKRRWIAIRYFFLPSTHVTHLGI